MMNLEEEAKLLKSLAGLPRVPLGLRPTPLEAMPRLSAKLGGPPLFIKRDDLTGLALGGNKTRMLEFSLADALRSGADTIVAGAAVQSNYCRQMAAACAKLGLELHLVLRPVRPVDKLEVQGNHLLQRIFGAKITVLDSFDRAEQQAAVAAKAQELVAAGRKIYLPRGPDTIDLDAVAYVEAALEIVRQSRELGIQPKLLYLTALDTTQAGLVLGFKYLHSGIQVKGFSPFENQPCRCANMARIANQAARRLGLAVQCTEADFDNDDSFVGERYGMPTKGGLEAMRLVARSEGILLDPVYTAKSFAALIAHIRERRLSPNAPVICMHTGGVPALFAYAADVLETST